LEEPFSKQVTKPLINADVNGALNISKKADMIKTISEVEISGVVATPKRIRVH